MENKSLVVMGTISSLSKLAIKISTELSMSVSFSCERRKCHKNFISKPINQLIVIGSQGGYFPHYFDDFQLLHKFHLNPMKIGRDMAKRWF
jgi:hypothetical protein